jgi:uncharacterized OsmC-like protein
MKNGVNVAAMSELMYEIHGEANEGIFKYGSKVVWSGGDLLTASLPPTFIGSVKSPRRFNWQIALKDNIKHDTRLNSDSIYSPEEMALTGLGACALLTMVKGCTTRGISLESLDFNLTAALYSSPSSPLERSIGDIDYKIRLEAESDVDDEIFSELLQKLSGSSPNHRTIIEPNSVSIKTDRERTINTLSETPTDLEKSPISISLNWDYGFQIHVDYDQNSNRRMLLDQPKQVGGIDLGANPQEVILTSVAACLMRSFIELVQNQTLDVTSAEIDVNAFVDMHGMLGMDKNVPVKVQDININISIVGSADSSAINDLLSQAVNNSAISRLVIEGRSIQIGLYRNQTLISEIISQ